MYCLVYRKIGTWRTEDWPFFGPIEEVKRAEMLRGALKVTVASKRWIRGKKDSNLFLCVFAEPNGTTSYHIGPIAFMFTCIHNQKGERGLFAALDLKEVVGVDMEHKDDDGVPHYLALNNCWIPKTPFVKEHYICPLWEITHKAMKCQDKSITYFCGY